MTSSELMTKVREEILKIEARRAEALLKSDVDALERILSEDFTYIHGNGRSDTKSAYLEPIGSGRTKYLAADFDYEDTRIYGSAAILTGRARLRLRRQDGEIDLQSRFTVVYVRQDGSWQPVAWQSTRLES